MLRISIAARYYSYPLREVRLSLPLCNRKTTWWHQMVPAATSHFWSKRVPHSLQIWRLIIKSTVRVNRGSAVISTNSTTSSYLHRYITHRYTLSSRWWDKGALMEGLLKAIKINSSLSRMVKSLITTNKEYILNSNNSWRTRTCLGCTSQGRLLLWISLKIK